MLFLQAQKNHHLCPIENSQMHICILKLLKLFNSRKQFEKENKKGIWSKTKAKAMEAKKAEQLRAKGWAIWYN